MAFRFLIFNSYLGFLLITVILGNISFEVGSDLLYRFGDKGKALGSNVVIVILNNKKKSGLFIYSCFTSMCGLSAMTDGPNLYLMWLASARNELRPPDLCAQTSYFQTVV